jgi:hypothetical protein
MPIFMQINILLLHARACILSAVWAQAKEKSDHLGGDRLRRRMIKDNWTIGRILIKTLKLAIFTLVA